MNARSRKNQCLDSIIVSNGGSTGRTEELKPKVKKISNLANDDLFLIEVLRVEREKMLVIMILFLYF